MLSVVIPTLNAAAVLPAAIAALKAGDVGGLVGEIVVVDGGSADTTAAIARSLGARVVNAPAGRGVQLAAGARAARGDWYLFLHADTRLGPGWGAAAHTFIDGTGIDRVGWRAAVFRYRLDDDARAARRLERMVAWRSRVLGLPYGDQGLLIGRAHYRAVGGFREIPLMEDVDIVRRIGKSGLTILDEPAMTSAARYRRGYLRRIGRNVVCLGLYFTGVPPRLIARLYQQ